MSSSDTSASVRLTGRVKWFNNKTGFGFITIVGGNEQFKDASEIFAHHSAIKVSQEQYRYLVEGEYVEFSVSDTASGDHKFQAADVRGVKGGKLFCETRNEQRANGPTRSHSSGDERLSNDGGRGRGQGRGRGGSEGRGRSRGGSEGRGGRGEWMLVRKDASEYKGSGRVYSSRPSGERQPREASLSESFVERTQPQSAPTKAPAAVVAPPVPASTPSAEPNEVPATPRAASSRKPKQSKPSS
jgi:cold shock CspA family protein